MATYEVTLPVTYWTRMIIERPEGLTTDELIESLDWPQTDNFEFEWKAFRHRIFDLIEKKDSEIEFEKLN